MIQIGLGLLLLAGAVVILTGAGDMVGATVDLFPLIGFGGTALIVACGALFIAHGIYSRRLDQPHDDRHAYRSAGLASALVIGAGGIALGAPLIAEALNLVTFAGFPGGYYVMAQGALIALFVLVLLFARKQSAIDWEEDADE